MCHCRHYVDRICSYTTGVNAATALCKRHIYKLSRQQAQWTDSVVTVAHLLTDVANWPRIKAVTQVGSNPSHARLLQVLVQVCDIPLRLVFGRSGTCAVYRCLWHLREP